MKTFLKFLLALVVLAIIAVVLYFGYQLTKKENTIPPNTFPDQTASSTPGTASSTHEWTFVTPAINTSAWKTYSNPTLGFSVKYPVNMVLNGDVSSKTFAFPKSAFHWPLQDDAKVTIIASSTCPALFVDGGGPAAGTSTFMLNGYTFNRTENHDAAAGNLYNEIAYDTTVNGMCYRIDFFDHGANGAGLYVGDPALIAQYDAQHAADMAAVLDIFNAMTESFEVSH